MNKEFTPAEIAIALEEVPGLPLQHVVAVVELPNGTRAEIPVLSVTRITYAGETAILHCSPVQPEPEK